jgi:serine/threonine protein kinase
MVRVQGTEFGDYRLLRLLGEGGFAEVYVAEHKHLPGNLAAIKLLKGSFTPQQIEMLRQEALIISKLDHPHIVQLRTFSIERKVPYLIMAYASGGSLATRHKMGTPLPLLTICEYVRQIATALHYAHSQRIIHRDIKPENILLTQDGRLQVADFGIAIMAQNTKIAQGAQGAQEIVGTWTYMAPEQFTGQSEPASDQYALGIMVYQWLCGNPPFTDSIYTLPYQHMSEPPPSLSRRIPALLPNIEPVVMKALAKKPAERFASLTAFAQAFEEACTTSPIGTTLFTYKHLGGVVNCAAWSPDGTCIASGGDDATVRIWDVRTGETLITLRGHSERVNAVGWSPDGSLLASASDDKTVQAWKVGSGKMVRRYEGHSSSVWAVGWSPDGSLVASASWDQTVQVWEVSTGKVLLTYRGHFTGVRDVAWSPDGGRIVSAGDEVRVWVAPH